MTTTSPASAPPPPLPADVRPEGWLPALTLPAPEQVQPPEAETRAAAPPTGAPGPAPGPGPAPAAPPEAAAVPSLGAAVRAALVTRLPLALRGGRVALGRPAAVGLALVGLLGAGLAVLLLLGGRAAPTPAGAGLDDGALTPSSARPTAPASAARGGAPAGGRVSSPVSSPTPTGAALELAVDVVGRVRRPGVQRLPPGTRVVDALAAAGGALPGTDLTDLGQARRLIDGEQVRVGLGTGTAPAGSPTGTGAVRPGVTGAATAPGADAPVDLNAATLAQLDALPGVGPVLAQRILDWREAHGGFRRLEDLRSVSGLGGKKYDALVPLVRAR